MKLDTVIQFYVQYHDPEVYRHFRGIGPNWYWVGFPSGPNEGRWETAREARDAFVAYEPHHGKKFRVVKITTIRETVLDLD